MSASRPASRQQKRAAAREAEKVGALAAALAPQLRATQEVMRRFVNTMDTILLESVRGALPPGDSLTALNVLYDAEGTHVSAVTTMNQVARGTGPNRVEALANLLESGWHDA